MAEQTIILIERRNSRQFARFIELFKNRSEIPIKEVRSKISKNSFYDIVLSRLYTLNKTIKIIDPRIESFIIPTLNDRNGRIVQTFTRNCEIEMLDKDPNFFHLRLKPVENTLHEGEIR